MSRTSLGTGRRTTFPMGRMIGLTLTDGLDYYPNVTIIGHDTSYGANGQQKNDRQGYT
jgi:hypothetical protein